MTLKGFDGWGDIDAKAAKAAGASFIMGYLSTTGNSKNITQGGVERALEEGLAIGFIFETYANRPLEGYNAGVVDAWSALNQLRNLGIAEEDMPVLFYAVDFDANPTAVSEYERGIVQVHASAMYGSYRVTTTDGMGSWQTVAWSGGLRDTTAWIYQTGQQERLSTGQNVDVNVAEELVPWAYQGADMPTPDDIALAILTRPILRANRPNINLNDFVATADDNTDATRSEISLGFDAIAAKLEQQAAQIQLLVAAVQGLTNGDEPGVVKHTIGEALKAAGQDVENG